MIRTLAITVLCGLAASAGAALAAPDPTALGGSIDKAVPKKANDRDPALVVKAEILLDRTHVSPGEIDGLDGDNFRNAVRAFQQLNGLPLSGDLDATTWGALKRDGAPVLKAYTITLADAAGPFTRAIPANLDAMARLPSAQREIRLLGDPRQNPIALARHKVRPAAAHPQRGRTANGALALRPLHNAGDAGPDGQTPSAKKGTEAIEHGQKVEA